MDDNEYYAMMRRQYRTAEVNLKKTSRDAAKGADSNNDKAKYTEWTNIHGREDAEMLNENDNDNIE